MSLTFVPLAFEHISLMTRWFNQAHVQAFYSLRTWTEPEVKQKLSPYIKQEIPIFGFVVQQNSESIAYCQFYRVADFPWPQAILQQEIISEGAGMDLFIGEQHYLNLGFGKKIILQCLEEFIWPKFKYCLVDPDELNLRAIACYEKLGFEKLILINTEDALVRPVCLQLMLRQQ